MYTFVSFNINFHWLKLFRRLLIACPRSNKTFVSIDAKTKSKHTLPDIYVVRVRVVQELEKKKIK